MRLRSRHGVSSPTGSANFGFSFGMSSISTSVCPAGADSYATPSDLSGAGHDYMLNPRYGTARPQPALRFINEI
jgi:hypothetical protein